jgi:hypothetical protein
MRKEVEMTDDEMANKAMTFVAESAFAYPLSDQLSLALFGALYEGLLYLDRQRVSIISQPLYRNEVELTAAQVQRLNESGLAPGRFTSARLQADPHKYAGSWCLSFRAERGGGETHIDHATVLELFKP